MVPLPCPDELRADCFFVYDCRRIQDDLVLMIEGVSVRLSSDLAEQTHHTYDAVSEHGQRF